MLLSLTFIFWNWIVKGIRCLTKALCYESGTKFDLFFGFLNSFYELDIFFSCSFLTVFLLFLFEVNFFICFWSNHVGNWRFKRFIQVFWSKSCRTDLVFRFYEGVKTLFCLSYVLEIFNVSIDIFTHPRFQFGYLFLRLLGQSNIRVEH